MHNPVNPHVQANCYSSLSRRAIDKALVGNLRYGTKSPIFGIQFFDLDDGTFGGVRLLRRPRIFTECKLQLDPTVEVVVPSFLNGIIVPNLANVLFHF